MRAEHFRANRGDYERARRILSLVLLCGLIGYQIFVISETWNHFIVTPDSSDYVKPWSPESIRSPGYPLFTGLVNGFDFYLEPSIYPQNVPIRAVDADSYFINIIRAQSLFLVIAFSTLTVVLMWCGFPILGPIFVGVFWLRGYQTPYVNHILAECLTESFLLLATAFFILLIKKKSMSWIFGVTVFSTLAFLTKPNAAYIGVLMALGIACCLYFDWRRCWRIALVSLAGAAAFSLWQPGVVFIKTGIFEVSGMSLVQKLGFSVQYAQLEDSDLLHSETAKQFLQRVVAEREKRWGLSKGSGRPIDMTAEEFMIANQYEIGLPIARQVAGERYQYLLKEFNDVVLRSHRLEHFQTFYHSFKSGIGQIRPKGGLLYILFVVFSLCCFLVSQNRNTFIAMALILTQLVGLGVLSLWGMPLPRYINALNLFGLLPMLFLFLSMKGLFGEKQRRKPLPEA